MRTPRIRLSISLLCALLVLAGCAGRSDHVIFVTKTSFGIDVEPSTSSAGVAYDRVEGYSSPMFAGGVAPPVLASFESDGKNLLTPQIKQVFATGEAARRLAGAPHADGAPTVTMGAAKFKKTGFTATTPGQVPDLPPPPPDGKPMFFGTGTIAGIKFGLSSTAMDGFTFGFKRKEVSVIPRNDDQNDLASVLASIEAGAGQPNESGSTDPVIKSAGEAKTTIRQFFATGDVADTLAENTTIRALFQRRARDSFTAFYEQKSQHNETALSALGCVLRVDDGSLRAAWADADSQQLFTTKGAIDALQGADAQKARAMYAKLLFLVDHNDPALNAHLREHRAYVCGLAGK